MKLYDQVTSGRWQVTGTGRPGNLVTRHVSRVTGFTMVEIAICLAIIGIALVAIIGVLPIGINVQRDNREETLIDQDATVLLENIRNGARGLDDLTNYVYAITNYWTEYTAAGKAGGSPVNVNGYTSAGAFVGPGYSSKVGLPLTNGVNIIGLLSTPEYTDNNGMPIATLINGGYSNYVFAYVHSLSGPAVEKPPQDNAILVGDSFGYKLICENVPVAVNLPLAWQAQAYSAGEQVFQSGIYWRATAPTLAGDVPGISPLWVQYSYLPLLAANLRELRLTFLWPLLPNGSPGNGRQTFRTTIAGQLVPTNVVAFNTLYFFQPQFFTNAP